MVTSSSSPHSTYSKSSYSMPHTLFPPSFLASFLLPLSLLRMPACTCVYVCVRVCVHVYVHVCVRIYMYMHVCVVCVYAWVCVHACMCRGVHSCMCSCMCVCMRECVCVWWEEEWHPRHMGNLSRNFSIFLWLLMFIKHTSTHLPILFLLVVYHWVSRIVYILQEKVSAAITSLYPRSSVASELMCNSLDQYKVQSQKCMSLFYSW